MLYVVLGMEWLDRRADYRYRIIGLGSVAKLYDDVRELIFLKLSRTAAVDLEASPWRSLQVFRGI